MKIAISTDSLKGHGLNRIFEYAKELGFDGIDLALDKKDLDTLDPDYLHKLSNSTGVPILSVQSIDGAKKEDVQLSIEIAKKVDARVIIIQAPKILDREYANWLRKEVPAIRKKENISIALENAPNKTWLGFIPERAMNNLSELKKFKHACLDTARVAEKKEDLMYAYGTLQKFLVHVHLSNFYRTKGYQILTKGTLPLESFLSKLAADDFKGTIALKISPKYLKVREKDEMFKLLKESIEFVKKYTKN